MDTLRVRRFAGCQDYTDIWQQMRHFTDTRTEDTIDEIWLLQHHPVLTLGQAGKIQHLLAATDIPVVKTDRGGQITYHGPGQLMVYVLLDLKRRNLGVRQLVTAMEKSVIAVLMDLGIPAYAKKSAPGVYVTQQARGYKREYKIAALGLRVRKGCCYHGIALNINMNLQPFQLINPCGYAGLATTQLADLLPTTPDWSYIENQLVQQLAQQLEKHLH